MPVRRVVQRDVLHGAGLIQHGDRVAEPEGLFQEEPDPGEHVAEQILKRKTDRDRAHTGGGEDHRDVDTVDDERADQRDNVGRDGDQVADEGAHLAVGLAPAHRPEHEHAGQAADEI